MAVDWWTPALAFLGGGGGAWLSYRAARRDTLARQEGERHDLSQRETQGRREEWGRRFTAALDDVASDQFRRRELGRAVLVHLSGSELATGEEGDLAKVVLETGARLEDDGDLLVDPPEGVTMDDLIVEEDDGREDRNRR
jgi:hypothetical protein